MPKFQAQEGGRSKAAKQARRYFDAVASLRAEGTPESRKQLKKLAEQKYHVAAAGPGDLWNPKAKRNAKGSNTKGNRINSALRAKSKTPR